MYKGIAISGKIASGKTTLAEAISKRWGIPRKSLAANLKEDVAAALYEAGLACNEEAIIERHKAKLRGTLQEWGKIFRELNGEDYWVNRLFPANGKDRHQENQRPFVCDDVRFQNEFTAFQRRGFLLVRLDTGGGAYSTDYHVRRDRLYPGLTPAQLSHPSETDLDGQLSRFDIILDTATMSPDETQTEFFKQCRRHDFSWD